MYAEWIVPQRQQISRCDPHGCMIDGGDWSLKSSLLHDELDSPGFNYLVLFILGNGEAFQRHRTDLGYLGAL
eukprot:c41510_g1_i1 orf=400-615(+)